MCPVSPGAPVALGPVSHAWGSQRPSEEKEGLLELLVLLLCCFETVTILFYSASILDTCGLNFVPLKGMLRSLASVSVTIFGSRILADEIKL